MVDLTDADLRGSTFDRVDLSGARLRRTNLDGITVRGADMRGVRLIGVELVDAQITGEIANLTINGVEVGAYVETELDRRHPDRVAMRPSDAEGFRAAWAPLERLWDGTEARARTFAPGAHDVTAPERAGGDTLGRSRESERRRPDL